MSTRPRQSGLPALLTKLKISFILSLLGSWALLALRLDLPVWDQAFFLNPRHLFYIDVGCIALVFFGLLSAFYYSRRLRPRIKRIHDLGEASW